MQPTPKSIEQMFNSIEGILVCSTCKEILYKGHDEKNIDLQPHTCKTPTAVELLNSYTFCNKRVNELREYIDQIELSDRTEERKIELMECANELHSYWFDRRDLVTLNNNFRQIIMYVRVHLPHKLQTLNTKIRTSRNNMNMLPDILLTMPPQHPPKTTVINLTRNLNAAHVRIHRTQPSGEHIKQMSAKLIIVHRYFHITQSLNSYSAGL